MKQLEKDIKQAERRKRIYDRIMPVLMLIPTNPQQIQAAVYGVKL